MRIVDFHKVHASFQRPLHRRHPVLLELFNVGLGHRLRRGKLVVERNVAGPLHIVRPATHCLGRHVRHTEPGRHRACLATGMGHLNPNDLVLAVHELHHAAEGLDLRVLPEPVVLRSDTTFRLHRRGFDHQKPRAALRNAAQMGHVSAGHVSIVGAVLTERRELFRGSVNPQLAVTTG